MDLNRGQRVVLVIGWGLILATVASTLSAEVAPSLGDGGWFNYAPNEGVFVDDLSGPSWGSALIWLGAVVLWVAGSLLLLRSPRPSSSG